MQTLIENSIRYDVPIKNENHKLNITAVQSVDKSLRKTLGYSVSNLPVDKTYNYIANGEVTGQQSGKQSRVIHGQGAVQPDGQVPVQPCRAP